MVRLALGICAVSLLLVPEFTPGQAQAPLVSSSADLPGSPGVGFVVQLIAIGPTGRTQDRACSASGFLIDEEGFVVTNAHVVEDARRCLADAPDAKILAKLTITDSRTALAVPCEVVGIDDPNDLALLKTIRPLLSGAGDTPPYATLDTRTVEVGTSVSVSGYPQSSWQPVTQMGQVVWRGRTLLAEFRTDPAPSSDALMVNIHLQPGNSGSPVYRAGGGVIAIVDERDRLRPAYSVAVAIHYAIELAGRHGARWHGVP